MNHVEERLLQVTSRGDLISGRRVDDLSAISTTRKEESTNKKYKVRTKLGKGLVRN